MLIAQGWKQSAGGAAFVRVIKIVANASGMRGWDLSVGQYQPDAGETIADARWEFICSGAGVLEMVRFNVADEIASWIDSQQQAIDVRDFCRSFAEIAKQMVATIEAHVPLPPSV